MKKLIKRQIIVLLIIVLFVCQKEIINAKISIGVPKIVLYKEVYREGMDGSNYIITWKPVKKADGYQFCSCSLEEEYGWSQYKFDTKKLSTIIEWPNAARKLKVKVRAYKVSVNGKKTYGKWSKKAAIKSKSNGMAPFEKVTKVK